MKKKVSISLREVDTKKMAEELHLSETAIKLAFKGPRVDHAQDIDTITTITQAKRAYRIAKSEERCHLVALKWIALCSTLWELDNIHDVIGGDGGEIEAAFDLRRRDLLLEAIAAASTLGEIDRVLEAACRDGCYPEYWKAFEKMLHLVNESSALDGYHFASGYFGDMRAKVLRQVAVAARSHTACDVIRCSLQDGDAVDGDVEYQNILIRTAAELYRRK